MALAGLRELGMDSDGPFRNLVVYMEIDRCGADAVQAITGCSLGHRTLKYRDLGKFAATFVDTRDLGAVRVSVCEKNRAKHDQLNKTEVIRALMEAPEPEVLRVEKVTLAIPPEDLPGFPKGTAVCSECGERVMDRREVVVDGKVLCRSCAHGRYYKVVGE